MTDDYRAVPPPVDSKNVSFDDALAKAKAIAAKLASQRAASLTDENQPHGTRRSFEQSGSGEHSDEQDAKRRMQYGGSPQGSLDHPSGSHSYSMPPQPYQPPQAGFYGTGANAERPRFGLGSEERQETSISALLSASLVAQVSLEFTVPANFVGLIIGRGGESLRNIERTTGAKIQFSQDATLNEQERKVTVIGSKDNADKGKEMVMRIVDEAMSSRSHGYVDPNATIMNIPNNKVGLVIGRGGETIRELQEKSGCKIAVTPDNAQKAGVNERSISLSGDPAAIQRAKQLIDEIIDPGRMLAGGVHPPPPGQESETVLVPNESVGLVIGRGGETIRLLQQQTGVRIQVEQAPAPNATQRNIYLTGPPEQLAYAKVLINEKISGNRNRSGETRAGGLSGYPGFQGYDPSGYNGSYNNSNGSANAYQDAAPNSQEESPGASDPYYHYNYQTTAPVGFYSGTTANAEFYAQYYAQYAQYYAQQQRVKKMEEQSGDAPASATSVHSATSQHLQQELPSSENENLIQGHSE